MDAHSGEHFLFLGAKTSKPMKICALCATQTQERQVSGRQATGMIYMYTAAGIVPRNKTGLRSATYN